MDIFRWLNLLFFLVLLSACAGPTATIRPESSAAPIISPRVEKSQPTAPISTARRMLGTPYRYGGAGPDGFDCSGLVHYAYQRAGIQVPRTSSEQYRQATTVDLANLQAGDLLFFRLAPPKVSHVAIYDRQGRFIHAPSSGKQVSYASLDNPYWRKHLVGAGRF